MNRIIDSSFFRDAMGAAPVSVLFSQSL